MESGLRQYFGERALLNDEPRAATVRVVSKDAKALALDKARTIESLEQNENGGQLRHNYSALRLLGTIIHHVCHLCFLWVWLDPATSGLIANCNLEIKKRNASS